MRIEGRWHFERGWPPEGVRARRLFAQSGGRLGDRPGAASEAKLLYRATVGTTGKTWAPNGDGSYGVDQRADDAYCVTFTSEPLAEPLEILGSPTVELHCASPAERMNWIVRLNDLFPDGTSQLVTRGILNGTHRRSHATPIALVPGEATRLSIEMQVTSWVFPKGHRLRLCVSNGEWPIVWPSPSRGTSSVLCGGKRATCLVLPARLPSRRGERRPAFLQPEPAKPNDRYRSFGDDPSWVIARDEGAASTTLRFKDESGTALVKEGLRFSIRREIELGASDIDPARAWLRGWAEVAVRGARKQVAVRADLALTSDARQFHLEVRRTMTSAGKRVRTRRWSESIPRRLV